MNERTNERTRTYALPAGGTRMDMAALGGPMRLLVGANDSGGGLTVLEQRLDEPGGPPLHVHDAADEVLMVIEGGPLTVVIGDRRLEVEEGGLAWIPRGTPHSFSNLSGRPLRMLGIATPGGMERALHEQAEYIIGLGGAQPPDVGTIVPIWKEKGRIVGPPVMPKLT